MNTLPKMLLAVVFAPPMLSNSGCSQYIHMERLPDLPLDPEDLMNGLN